MKKTKFLLPLMTATLGLATVIPSVSCSKSVTSVTITNKTAFILMSGTAPHYQFEARISPDKASVKKVNWSVNFDGIEESEQAEATIDQEGKITFTDSGYVNVVAEAGGKSDTCKVRGYTNDEKRIAQAAGFYNANWSDICGKTLSALKTAFGLDNNEDFIGFIKEITLNNKQYYVRVIGEQHDEKKNAVETSVLTFELCSVYQTKSKWNKTSTQFANNYLSSTLRANLEYTAFKEAFEETEPRTFSNDIYKELISSNEGLTLQKVNKQVATKTSDTWSVTAYDSYIFPLTATEMGLEGAYTEGSAYKFYTESYSPILWPQNIAERRIKSPNSTTGKVPYWIASPGSNSNPTYIKADGTAGTNYSTALDQYISFAFCI